MENNQSSQKQRSKTSSSQAASSLLHPKVILAAWSSSFKLLKNNPWLIFSGVLLVLFSLAGMSIMSLTYVKHTAQQVPESAATLVKEEVPESSAQGKPTDLWLLVAIAASCAVGSLLIFKHLNRSLVPSKPIRRVKTGVQVQKNAPREKPARKTIPPQPVSVSVQKSVPRPMPVASLPPKLVPKTAPPMPITPTLAKNQPVMTVLPPESTYKLDRQDTSLADVLDIRKQRSLSSILRE
jgi:hypothetical protein